MRFNATDYVTLVTLVGDQAEVSVTDRRVRLLFSSVKRCRAFLNSLIEDEDLVPTISKWHTHLIKSFEDGEFRFRAELLIPRDQISIVVKALQ